MLDKFLISVYNKTRKKESEVNKMNFVLFGIIIAVWMGVGMVGVYNCKRNKVNFEMIIFIAFFPFIPLVALAFGII